MIDEYKEKTIMNENLNTTRPALARPWVYFLATYVWSCLFGGTAILMDLSMETAAGLVLVLLAAVGPMVMGIAFTTSRVISRDDGITGGASLVSNAYPPDGIWSYFCLCPS
jgi:hypothetical protein